MFGVWQIGNPAPMSATDKIKNTIEDTAGKAKEAVGKATGDDSTKNEGKADQASGQLQNAYGSAKDGAREAAGTLEAQITSFTKERPVVALLSAAGVGWVLSRLMRRG